MNATQIRKLLKMWNPEINSVNVLKIAFTQFTGRSSGLISALETIEVAEQYKEQYLSLVKNMMIWTIDYQGNCLIGEGNEVKHISELI
jgi:hypothetical protein